jgi:hypothetical protein
MNSSAHALRPLPPYSNKFRPTRGNINCHQGIQVKTIQTFATMRYQVNLNKPRAVLLPVGKGADGYGIPDQIPWLGG